MEYAVIVEKGPTSYGAYVPDLPGCIAVGETRAETMKLIREAIRFHLEGMRGKNRRIPRPNSKIEYVKIAA